MLLVLVVSLVEAFLVLPNHLSHALAKSDVKEGKVQAWVNRKVMRFGEKAIFPAATLAVRWRYLTMGIAVAAMTITVGAMAGGILKFAPFPELEGDVIEARILLPQGTPLTRTKEVVARVNAALEKVNQARKGDQPEGKPLVENVTSKFNINVDAHETGAHVATVTVDLLSSEQRKSDEYDLCCPRDPIQCNVG